MTMIYLSLKPVSPAVVGIVFKEGGEELFDFETSIDNLSKSLKRCMREYNTQYVFVDGGDYAKGIIEQLSIKNAKFTFLDQRSSK